MQAEHALQLAQCVDHRHGAKPMLMQAQARLGKADMLGQGLHIAGHDVAAAHLAKAALINPRLGLQKNLFEVFAGNIEQLAAGLEHGIQIRRSEAQAVTGDRITGLVHVAMFKRAVRVLAAQGVIEQQRNQQQANGVQPHRIEGEVITQLRHFRAGQYRGQGHRATRRMQTAQGKHPGNRQAASQRRHQRVVTEPGGATDADNRGDQVATENRPGLRQRAGRHGKQQHCGRAHGRDQPGAGTAQHLAA